MRKSWVLSTTKDRLTVQWGEQAYLSEDMLSLQAPEDTAKLQALFKADELCLRIAAAPGELVVDGRLSPGGIAGLHGQSAHSIRVGDTAIEAQPAAAARITECDGTGTVCRLSGDPVLPGEKIIICSCSTTVLSRFAREYGSLCPRCGSRLCTEEDR